MCTIISYIIPRNTSEILLLKFIFLLQTHQSNLFSVLSHLTPIILCSRKTNLYSSKMSDCQNYFNCEIVNYKTVTGQHILLGYDLEKSRFVKSATIVFNFACYWCIYLCICIYFVWQKNCYSKKNQSYCSFFSLTE